MAVVYPFGQVIEDSYFTTNFAGGPANPTTTTFYLITPAGVRTDYVMGVDAELTRPATGTTVFAGVPLEEPGDWLWGWHAEGAIGTSREGVWVVGNTNLP